MNVRINWKQSGRFKEKGVRNATLHAHDAVHRPDADSWQERVGQERLVMAAGYSAGKKKAEADRLRFFYALSAIQALHIIDPIL